MMAAGKEKLLVRPLVFQVVVAPVVTRSKAAPRATGFGSSGEGDEAKEENFGDWSEFPR